MDVRVLRDRGRVKSFYQNSGAEFELCAKLMLSGDHDSDTDGAEGGRSILRLITNVGMGEG